MDNIDRVHSQHDNNIIIIAARNIIMMRLLYVCINKNSPKVEPFVNASECVV